uniref:UPF0187-domain-containing protein n=1 Tax=Panagrellus redivivus TaxID=6233 RepID=A0A7E4UUJ7_PANRE
MTTTAERRQQLEYHLNSFRELAEERYNNKVIRWCYHIPALVSATLAVCQLFNTTIFGLFAYNFGKLYVLLDEYMLATNGTSLDAINETGTVYEYEGINAERITQIDLYHDKLWTMFVAEVIQLVFPCIALGLFVWKTNQKSRKLNFKALSIFLLCPALSLLLSLSQACMIHVTLSQSVGTIRFLLAKLMSTLLAVNLPGRLPIEEYFECEFFNDDDIVKPPCAGTIHDQVVSPFTLNLMIGIHIIPVIVFIYLWIKNLSDIPMEHIFLYIESVDSKGRPTVPEDAHIGSGSRRTLKDTLNEMLTSFDIKFGPTKPKTTRSLSLAAASPPRMGHGETYF